MFTDRQAIAASSLIKRYCEEHLGSNGNCSRCIFASDRTTCQLTDHDGAILHEPMYWNFKSGE